MLSDEAIIENFFVYSVLYSKYLGPAAGGLICDIGSGYGFPGIPLSICFPGLRLEIIESSLKKTVFLKELIYRLKLKNCLVINQRLEDVAAAGGFNLKYDSAVSRAFTGLEDNFDNILKIIKLGGVFAALRPKKSINDRDDAGMLRDKKISEIKHYKLTENLFYTVIKK